MAYSKTNWVNENEPAINADNLNKIEAGIEDNSLQLESYGRTINEIIDNKLDIVDVLNEASTDTDKPYSADYLNDKLVSVGTSAPSDGRRVWFKKGKNMWKFGDFQGNASKMLEFTFPLPKGTYAFSFNVINATGKAIDFYTSDNVRIKNLYIAPHTTATLVTSTFTADVEIARVQVYGGDSADELTEIQLEEGSTATTYEAYVKPAIYVDGVKIYEMS